MEIMSLNLVWLVILISKVFSADCNSLNSLSDYPINARIFPSESNIWILLLPVSVTIILSKKSTAAQYGELNSPMPEPKLPITFIKFPSESNIWILWLEVSETIILSRLSVSTQCGELNSPTAEPNLPIDLIGLPVGSKMWTWLLSVSATMIWLLE